MQLKLRVTLCVIIILIGVIISGCIYNEYENKNANERVIEQTTEKVIITSIITTEENKEQEETSKSVTEENDITIEIETDKEVDTNQAVEPVSLGEFKLTAYCSCEKCCGKWALNRPIDEDGNEIVYGSIGERLQAGYSIAVDPTVIPYRTEVIINGHTYKAQDCGGSIKGNRIDIYFDNHQDATKFGVQYAEVFVIPQ